MTERAVAAWKCEECLRWRSPDMAANSLIVKEPGTKIMSVGGVTETIFEDRKIVVCDECRAKITGVPWGGWSP